MEENIIDNDMTQTSQMGLNMQSLTYLRESSRWAKFLAILGFIGCGLLAAIGLAMGPIMKNLPNSSAMGGFPYTLITMFYLVIAIIYFMPALYLFRFATNTSNALKQNNELLITKAFSNLKSMFRYMGILAIVILSIYALVVAGMFIAFGMR